MGCLGQVDIKEDDDYAKWEIKIFVSFRDNEEVSELTAQRQSGGVSAKRIGASVVCHC